MRRFLIPRLPPPPEAQGQDTPTPQAEDPTPQAQDPPQDDRHGFNLDEIVSDPALRKQIHEFAPEIRDQVRRAYIQKGPTRPKIKFPLKLYGDHKRGFSKSWYEKYPWIEYSESKDAAFCFYCFLFKQPGRAEHHGYAVFNETGFNDWKHAYKALPEHVGGLNSAHNICVQHCDDFKNQRQSVSTKLSSATKEAEELYRIRLTSSLECSRFLISQGMAFRGHDESSTSLNRGNFLEMIDWYKDKNEIVRHAFDRGGMNCQMISPDIQKDITRCCAEEITEVIMGEIGDRKFSVLIDESRDISIKEQMAVMLRYVDVKGKVVERFLTLHHVTDTTSDALKVALLDILDKYKLSISRIRGQGYDGASNMRGEFNGLQKKIVDENPHAFYVHCFAHRLQLVVVAVASCCPVIHDFFEYVSQIVNITSASCKRRDALTEIHHNNILAKLDALEIDSGRGKNQQTVLARAGDTRWGSHHITLLRLEQMWEPVTEVLEMVEKDFRNSPAGGLLNHMECFEFVFVMKLMLRLFAITNELSHTLQRKDINIIHAMELIQDVKSQLVTMRDSGWEEVFNEAKQYCENQNIEVPNMLDEMPVRGRAARRRERTTCLQHYRVGIFYVALDKICVEMDHRFRESTIEILICFSCLDPKNNFSRFDATKLVRVAEIYSADFSTTDLALIRSQLETYILQVRRHAAFATCTDIASLASKMVETEKHIVFPLVYRLIELALILPVSTASVERAFSAMKIIKSKLRNKMTDEWFNNLMVCYIEREIFRQVDNATILRRFQGIKTRKMNLPRRRHE